MRASRTRPLTHRIPPTTTGKIPRFSATATPASTARCPGDQAPREPRPAKSTPRKIEKAPSTTNPRPNLKRSLPRLFMRTALSASAIQFLRADHTPLCFTRFPGFPSNPFRIRAAVICLSPALADGKVCAFFYASLVQALHPHPPRGPGRRRSGQPQVSAPRRLHPPARRRHLQLPLPRPALAQQDHRHRARGDGPDRPGVLPARHPAQRAVG